MITHYSHSSTAAFRRCLERFYQLYVKEKGSVTQEKGMGQRLGSAGHLAFKAFYSGYPSHIALDWAYEELAPSNQVEENAWKSLEETLVYYWTHTLTDRWAVLEVEKEVRIGRYMGILDLVVKDSSGRVMIVDHKFQKSTSVHHLEIDPQISFYLLLARELGIGAEGLLYNIIPMGKLQAHPVRKYCTRSQVFLDNFKKDLDSQIERMDIFQAVPISPYRNWTADCPWDCSIYAMCKKGMEDGKERIATNVA